MVTMSDAYFTVRVGVDQGEIAPPIGNTGEFETTYDDDECDGDGELMPFVQEGI